jgi:hypothetical protein
MFSASLRVGMTIETDGSDADMFKAHPFASGSREVNEIRMRFQHFAKAADARKTSLCH